MSNLEIKRSVEFTATLGTLASYRPFVTMSEGGYLVIERGNSKVDLFPSEVIDLYRFIQRIHPEFERPEDD